MMWARSKFVTAACGPIGLLLVILTPARAEIAPIACRLFSPTEVEHALQVPVNRPRAWTAPHKTIYS